MEKHGNKMAVLYILLTVEHEIKSPALHCIYITAWSLLRQNLLGGHMFIIVRQCMLSIP